MAQVPPPPPSALSPSSIPPPPPPAAVARAEPARWRDQRGLTISLVVVFGVMLAASVALSIALLQRISVVHDFEAGRFADALQRADDADDFVGAAAAGFGITQFVIVVLFIIWTFRAAKNSEALERSNPRLGPGWAIGSWFVPLANLVLPVLLFQDLWRGATPDVPRGDPNWRRAAGSWLIGVWWMTWVLSLIRYGASNSGLDDRATLDEIETSNTIALVGVAFTAVAAVLAATVVFVLARRQLDTLQAQRRAYATAAVGELG